MNNDAKIKAVMAAVFDLNADDIDEDASPDSIEIWDSLHHMNLIVALEEEFGITFTEDDISNMLNFKLIRLTISEYAEKK